MNNFKPISAIDNAIDILLLLSKNPDKSIRDLSDDLNISKSTLHRSLQTLENRGFVYQDRITEKYSLGFKILELSKSIQRQNVIRNASIKYMKKLSEETGDTVQLSILENESILILEVIEGKSILRIFARPGERLPLTYGNFGKIFLSNLSTSSIKHLLLKYPLKKYTNYSITDENMFIDKLIETKEEGISYSIDDPIEGAISVAAPIFDSSNEIVASISIVSVKTTNAVEDIDNLKAIVKKYTEKITKALNK